MPTDPKKIILYVICGIAFVILSIIWLFTPLGAFLNTMMAVIAVPSLLVYAIWSFANFLKKRFFTKPVEQAPVPEIPVEKKKLKRKTKKKVKEET